MHGEVLNPKDVTDRRNGHRYREPNKERRLIRMNEKNKYIPYGRQSIDEDDIQAVIDVLRSDWITQGPKIEEFENKLADYCGAKYTVAVSSGTAALHIACLAAGIKEGDEVITSPITFAASANCVLYCGARPVFADIKTETINIDPKEIEKNITKKTKAIIPVHFAGYPCDIKLIHSIAKKHNLIVIEDGCHALGAQYKSKDKWVKVGSCKHSDMTVFSFHPVKNITTGEGGAVTTNNMNLYKRLKALRSHGIYKDKKTLEKGPWYYEMRELGFNYRITDFQCTLGISQLKKLDIFLKKRKDIVKRYSKAFKDNPYFDVFIETEDTNASWHLYPIMLKNTYKKKRKEIFNNFRQRGLGVQVHYIPVYWQPYYKKLGFMKGACPK
ncbi:UDP-4-amino-4,6-dideoxy-N-acetyl-beta-L-altrosamine transaminase, partial [Chlamydiota bacterium]